MKAKKITAMLAAAGMILTALFPATKTEAGATGQEAPPQAVQESSTGKLSVNGTVLVGYEGEDEELVIPEGIEGKQGVYFYKVSGEVDYNSPDLTGLPEYMEYLEYNRHVVQLIGMKEMELMPDFQEKTGSHYLSEGRFLTEKDGREQNQVCVIQEEYARLRGLQVGDTIRLDLKDKDQKGARPELIYNKYPYWEDWELWRDCDSQELELEIVGLYNVYARLWDGRSGA